VGARALGCRPWERISTLFAVIQIPVSRRSLDQSILKMRIFFLKTKNLHKRPTLAPLAESFKLQVEKLGTKMQKKQKQNIY